MGGLLNLGAQYVGPIEPPAVIWREYTRSVLEGEPAEEFEGINTSRYDPPPPPPSQARSAVPGTDAGTTVSAAGSETLTPNAASPARGGAWAQQTR